MYLWLWLLVLFLVSPMVLSAQIEFESISPNTLDDTNLEYIDLRNIGCSDISLAGYSVSDVSPKTYTFPLGAPLLPPHTSYRLTRPISKLALNNENETLFLSNSSGILIDTFAYSSSEK